MNDTAGVAELDGIADLAGECDELGFRQRPARRNEVVEAGLAEVKDDVAVAGVGEVIVHADDVRVPEALEGRDFVLVLVGEIAGEGGDLRRELAIVSAGVDLVNIGGAAGADQLGGVVVVLVEGLFDQREVKLARHGEGKTVGVKAMKKSFVWRVETSVFRCF